jgi:hypothetical protein
MVAVKEELLNDCTYSYNLSITEEALEGLLVDCRHKQVYDRKGGVREGMSIDYKSNATFPRMEEDREE